MNLTLACILHIPLRTVVKRPFICGVILEAGTMFTIADNNWKTLRVVSLELAGLTEQHGIYVSHNRTQQNQGTLSMTEYYEITA